MNTKKNNKTHIEENESISLLAAFKLAAFLRGGPVAAITCILSFFSEKWMYRDMLRKLSSGRELYSWETWSLGDALLRMIFFTALAFIAATTIRFVQLALIKPGIGNDVVQEDDDSIVYSDPYDFD